MGGLRRFTNTAPTLPFPLRQQEPAGERCEMCGTPIAGEHPHVVNIQSRRLLCTCRPCHLLFTRDGAGWHNFRAVPDRYLADPEHPLTAAQWEALDVPVGMAFFFHNSVLGRVVAQYPSPAGATESLLDLTAWEAIEHPLAAALEPDVEALVVRRTPAGIASYLVPIDRCYELVGLMRLHWTGFDGGPEARADIETFFARIEQLARHA